MSSRRILPLIILLLAAFPAHSANEIQTGQETDSETANESRPAVSMAEHRRQVGQRAMYLLGALTAEMTAEQGEPASAYAYYVSLFRRTQDQAAIARAVELALQSRHTSAARAALQQWQQSQPQAPNQADFKRLQWQLAGLSGNLSAVSTGLPEALSEPQKHKLRANFRQLAQLLTTHPKIASPANVESIIQAARQHPDMIEANIAAALFAAAQDRESDSHTALQSLQNESLLTTNDLSLVLEYLQQRHPQQLQRFFEQHPVQRQHSNAWQTAYAFHLLATRRLHEAYTHITNSNSTHLRLRIQAAYLAVQLHNDHAAAQSHLEAAYQNSPDGLKKFIVRLIIDQLLLQNQTHAAKYWLSRMTDADEQFSRHLFAARIAIIEHNTAQARRHLQQAQRQRNREILPLLEVQLEFDQLHSLQTAIDRIERILANPDTQLPADLPPEQRSAILESLNYHHTFLLIQDPARLHQAIPTLQQYIRDNPDNPFTLNALGYTMLSLPNPDLDEARHLIEKAHRLAPDNGAIRDSLGWVLFKQGHTAEALPHLQAAYANQADGEIAAHLIEVLHQLGQHEAIQTLLRQIPTSEHQNPILKETLQRLNLTLPKPHPSGSL